MLCSRVKVLEDILGFEDTLWSPWPWPRRSDPWPRSLKSSKIVLSSVRGQHYFFIVEILLENTRNFAGNLQRPFFVFLFRRSPEKFFQPFFLENAWKNFFRTFFSFRRTLAPECSLEYSCLGIERICPRKGCPWPWLRIFLWPWPRTLCPQLHLCFAVCTTRTGSISKKKRAILHCRFAILFSD